MKFSENFQLNNHNQTNFEFVNIRIDRSRSVTHTRMNSLTFFKLISKLNFEQIPKELLEYQLKSKKEKGYKYTNSTYELKVCNLQFSKEVDDTCALWIEKGCTSNTVNYEGILRNFGRDEADRVFPQDEGKIIPPLNEEVVHRIHKITLELIDHLGGQRNKRY